MNEIEQIQQPVQQPLPRYNSDRYLWLQSQTKIDLLSLDTEVEQIAELVRDASANAAVVLEYRDTMKEYVKLVYATVYLKIKSDGIKRNDSQIEAEVTVSNDYQAALSQASQARLDASLWQSLSSALLNKSYALTTASDLIKTGFIIQDKIIERRRVEIRGATTT